MSDHSHAPTTSSTQSLRTVLLSFVLPLVVIVSLVAGFLSGSKAAASSTGSEKAIAQRIQKVGAVEIRDANREMKTGEQVFKAQCSACHATGAAGSPKFGDAGAWGPRIKAGFDTLLNSALKGKGNMGAQGGGDFSEYELARAVIYMANAGGAKFDEPKKPEAAK